MTENFEYAYRTEKYYSASKRLEENNTPTLKCNMKGLENSSAIRFTNTIGILSVDEMKLGGEFLRTNASAYYWTMTPNVFEISYYGSDTSPIMYSFDRFGIIVEGAWISSDCYTENCDYKYSIRPAVVLRSAVKLKEDIGYIQDGTIDKPYVIN